MSENELVLVIDDLDDLPEVEEKTEVRLSENSSRALNLESGERAFLYPNGDLRNWRGHWLQKPPPAFGSAPSITPATAQEMGRAGGRARHERTQEFMRKGMIEKVKKKKKLSSDDPAEAYAAAAVEIFDEVLGGKGDISERRLFLNWFGVKADLIPGAEGGIVINAGAAEKLTPEATEALNMILPYARKLLESKLNGGEIAHANVRKRKLLDEGESEVDDADFDCE